jgi:alpha-L-fucosidase
VDYLHAQVEELVSKYGTVDVLWWDYSSQDFQGDTAWRAFDLMEKVRTKHPAIIMNNRLFRSREAGWSGMGTAATLPQLDPKYGDFITPEQHIPATGMPGVDWETCMTMNTTWGYSKHDRAWKSAETLIRNLIDIASKGGNYLLNIGPKGDGTVPEESVQAMEAIGVWMKKNGEAIYGTSASPFEKLEWGRCTRKELGRGVTRLYLHVFDWPENGQLKLPDLTGRVRRAYLLDGRRPLEIRVETDGNLLVGPTTPPDSVASVISLDVQRPPTRQRPGQPSVE